MAKKEVVIPLDDIVLYNGDEWKNIHGEHFRITAFDVSYGHMQQDIRYFDKTNNCLTVVIESIDSDVTHNRRAWFLADTKVYTRIKEGDGMSMSVIADGELFLNKIRGITRMQTVINTPRTNDLSAEVDLVVEKKELVVEPVVKPQEYGQLTMF